MGQVRPFIRNSAFSPEAIEVMSEALERARGEIEARDAQTHEALAMSIITLASCGELDVERLSKAAISNIAGVP